MKAKKYYVFYSACIIFFILSALAGEKFLAILITSFIWVFLWYLSNKKHINQFEEVNNNNIKLAKELDGSETSQKQLFQEFTEVVVENKRLAATNQLLTKGLKRIESERLESKADNINME